MEKYAIAIFVCLFLLLGVMIWQLVLLYKQVKSPTNKLPRFDVDKYYELKYLLQYSITIYPTIIAILAFLGYNSLSTMHNEIKEETLKNVTLRMDSLTKKIIATEANVKFIQDSVKKIESNISKGLSNANVLTGKISASSNSIKSISDSLTQVQKNYRKLNERDILKQPIYIVDSLIIDKPFSDDARPCYFSELKTISGKKLPVFSKEPLILAFVENGLEAHICNVTNRKFDIRLGFPTTTFKDCATFPKGKIHYKILIIDTE
ncbi:MAG TPA: hypothetical protein VNB90_12640 [Cytophagaceae bacterium]|jgi:hypothetical protein|nr:hypothetical protein [Cytophagaceae bacterium]